MNAARSDRSASKSGSWFVASPVGAVRAHPPTARVRTSVVMHISSLHSQTNGSAVSPDVSLDSSIHSLISRDRISLATSSSRQSVMAATPCTCQRPLPLPWGRGQGERLRLAVADGQGIRHVGAQGGPRHRQLRTRLGPDRGSGSGTTPTRPRSRDAPSPRPPVRRRSQRGPDRGDRGRRRRHHGRRHRPRSPGRATVSRSSVPIRESRSTPSLRSPSTAKRTSGSSVGFCTLPLAPLAPWAIDRAR